MSEATIRGTLRPQTVRGSIYVGAPAPGGDGDVEYGYGLKLVGNTLMVDAANVVQQDNTKPVTSAAVYTEVGNINALLATI